MLADGLTARRAGRGRTAPGAGRCEVNDNYYRVPAAGGVNSNIKDMALWMVAQMGAMPRRAVAQVLETIHAPLVKTPGERGRMRKFLERLGEAEYGYGWRSYDYAGHRIVGHRGGVNGYRSLILFDPQKKSGVVALWNSNTGQPGGLEFEVMDMLYHLRSATGWSWTRASRGVAVKRPGSKRTTGGVLARVSCCAPRPSLSGFRVAAGCGPGSGTPFRGSMPPCRRGASEAPSRGPPASARPRRE